VGTSGEERKVALWSGKVQASAWSRSAGRALGTGESVDTGVAVSWVEGSAARCVVGRAERVSKVDEPLEPLGDPGSSPAIALPGKGETRIDCTRDCVRSLVQVQSQSKREETGGEDASG
jgi:hypothetical protein